MGYDVDAVTTGHVLYMLNTFSWYLACILHGQSSCYFHMTCQVLENMPSGHITVKKGSGQEFDIATPCHTTESVGILQID